MNQWLKNELRENWFKFVAFIVCSFLVYDLYGDVKAFLKKPTTVITQTADQKPTNINPYGNITVAPPAISVNVQPSTVERTVSGVQEKPNYKTSPDVVVDEKNTYKLSYNGKPYEFKPDIKENYKFERGQLVIDKTSSYNVNVSVPVPAGGVGIGRTLEGKTAVMIDYRFGKTPFNVWAYQGGETAYGVKLVWYK